MKYEYFPLIKKFVEDSFIAIDNSKGVPHLERTLYWVKNLKPDYDEALIIAAFGHDIERAFRSKENYEAIAKSPKGFAAEGHLRPHQEKGAKILSNKLIELGASKELADKVHHLVIKHEVGGDEDQNILKDADSISFLETNAKAFILKFVPLYGKEKVKDKIDWMYTRITLLEAKELARPLYEDALGHLNKA